MNFIKQYKYIILSLLVICVSAFLLRTVYTHDYVFGNSYISFTETDAYNRMLYAQRIAMMPFGEGVMYSVDNNLLFSWIIAGLSHVLPIEPVGAWLPPVLAVFTVLVVFALGNTLFNKAVGLLSALFVAIIPSEFFHRSILGFTDHHVLECLLMVLALWMIARAIQVGGWFNRYTVLAGVALFLYKLNWVSGIYLAALLFAFIGPALLIHNLLMRRKWHHNLSAIKVPAVISLALYLPLGGYRLLLFLFPGAASNVSVQTTGEIVGTVFAPLSTRTISEIMPLLFPYGSFSLAVIVTNLHLFAITFLLGLVLLWRYRHEQNIILLAAWTAVMLIITLNQRRFMYYLTLNIAIISAFAIVELGKLIKGNIYQTAFIMSIPLIVFSVPMDRLIASHQPAGMTPEWHTALVWLKDQPGDGKVSAWGDYGHWIEYTSGKTPNYMPGPGGTLVAKLLLSTDDDESLELLDAMETDYLIVDHATMTNKWFALVSNAGRDVAAKSTTLGMRLLSGRAPPYLELAYDSATLKIFRYRPKG